MGFVFIKIVARPKGAVLLRPPQQAEPGVHNLSSQISGILGLMLISGPVLREATACLHSHYPAGLPGKKKAKLMNKENYFKGKLRTPTQSLLWPEKQGKTSSLFFACPLASWSLQGSQSPWMLFDFVISGMTSVE